MGAGGGKLRVFALMLGLAVGPAAHADVSDSGNLSIGGYAAIGGTMTVVGSEFSVGGSSFAVSEGTVQVSGLILPSNVGIRWADGSVSTTAFTGGSASAYNIAYASGTADVNAPNGSWGSVVGSTVSLVAQADGGALRGKFTATYRAAVSGGDSFLGRFLLNGSPVSVRPDCAGFTASTNGSMWCVIDILVSTHTTASATYSLVYEHKGSDANAVLCADGSICDSAGQTGRPDWFISLEDLR